MTLADIIPSLRGSLPRTLDKDLWPATVRHLPGGDVSVAGVSLVEIAARYDSPTVVLDCDELQARCGGLRRVFGDACVAVAGGSVFAEHTVDLLAASGLSLAVLGDAELAHALAAGFPAERIVVDCGGLHSGTLRRAVSAGVGRFVVSSLEEIEQLAAAVPGSLHAEVTLTVTARSADVIPIDSRRRTRGGLAIGSTSLQKALTRLIAAPGLRLVGVQTGLGDSAMDVESLACSCRDTLHCLSAIRDETGIELSEIAIRGGGGRCAGAGEETLRPPVSWIGLYELASAQRQCIAAVSAELALHVPRVTVEPSWPVAAAAVVTLCRVVAVRGDAGRVVVEVDAGTSSTVGSRTDRAAMLLGRLSPAQDRRVDIVAAACSTRSDTIQTLLPADIKVGDLIALPSVGDAAFAMTTSAVHVAVAAGRSWPLLESGPTRHGLLRRRVG